MAWEAKLAGHPFLDYSQLADANAAKGELREAGWSSCRVAQEGCKMHQLLIYGMT